MKLAAAAAVVGLDVMALLRNTDPVETMVLNTVVQEAIDQAELRDRNLAVLIANEVVRRF